MNATRGRIAIKLFHTAVWAFFNAVIFYLLHAVVVGRIDRLAWTCLALILGGCLVLVLFRMACPPPVVARCHTASEAPI